MAIETVMTCPLNSQCTEIKDGKMHVCRWLIKMEGKNTNTGAHEAKEDCAIAWFPLLLIENSAQQRSTAAAVESFRNETVKSQTQFNEILLNATKQKFLGN